VTVRVVADTEQALNVGQLISDSGRIGMFGALVRQGGVVEANSAVVGANGEIRLVATRDLTLDAGSRTTANGPGGGNILLQAEAAPTSSPEPSKQKAAPARVERSTRSACASD